MPDSYLDWFLVYLALGVACFLFLRLAVYIFHRKESPSVWVQEVMAVFEKEKTTWDRIKKILLWVGTLAMFCLIWPLAILIALHAVIFEKQTPYYRSDEPRFKCQKESLIKQVEPLEIEDASYVTDPLGRVPNVPYGHLHQGWINLLAQLEPTDQLWSFKTKGWVADQPNSPKYLKPRDVNSGFAIVRKKKVVAEFICAWD